MRSLLVLLLVMIIPAGAIGADWYNPPGQLMDDTAQGQQSSVGSPSTVVYYPNMRFPIENGPVYLNSQVYRPGGGSFSGAASLIDNGYPQCSTINYSYPWEDTFCEHRGRERNSPLCEKRIGHQGVDIRPSTCKANFHWAVAADDGLISHIGSYSVTLMTEQGVKFVYLHLNMNRLAVREMQLIKKGERIGQVSNFFAGTPTTWHLHFEIWDTMRINGVKQSMPLPPYSSLVAAYAEMMGLPQ